MKRAVCVLLAGALCACGSSRLILDPDPGIYDLLPAEEQSTLREARAAFDAGEHQRAWSALSELTARAPEHLGTRTFLQEVELALLEAGHSVGEVEAPADPALAGAALFASYLARAEARPDPPGLVLAARLAGDDETALALLARAEELDPQCVWIHYGRSFWLFSRRRFPEAREAMTRARDIDPGHLPTMRLYSSMLASAGDPGLAIQALTAWLERTQGDPLVPRAHRAEALADLAALLVLEGEEKEALGLLDEVDEELLHDPSRVELVRAAAHQARGDLDRALRAARRAWELGSESLLPLVQEAILVSQVRGDHEEERDIWERLLEAAARERERRAGLPPESEADAVDFQSLLIQLMAHTRLEELRRAEPGISDRPRP